MAAMVTPKGTPIPTPIFVDDARPLDDDGRLGRDDGGAVDAMVGAADEEVGGADDEVVAAEPSLPVKTALEVMIAWM